MVNELGISREDIKEWTMQAVSETVDKILRGIDMEKLAYDIAKTSINNTYGNYSFVKEVFAKVLQAFLEKRLAFTVKLKEEE
jgi:ribosomal protein S4